MAKRYVVAVPLAVINDVNGAAQYVYQGREITFDVDAERLEQLLADESVVEVDAEDAVAVTFAGPPAKRAKADDWIAFAVADGMTAEEANRLGKKGLVARYYEGDTSGTGDEDDETGGETGNTGE